MVYFTSDLHFGHDKFFIVQARGFETVEEMNAAIVERWNAKVAADDTVYVLGDLMLGNQDEGVRLISTLNGRIKIIRGNHDGDEKIEKILKLPNVESVEYATVFKYGKASFWLCHYPTVTTDFQDDKTWHKHLICLFGHTHQNQPFYKGNPYIYNVGVDAHNCTPISIEEIIEAIKKENP